jgi:hypothetical protein
VPEDLDGGRDELQLVRRLAADPDQDVVGVVCADLLCFRQVVDDLVDREKVGERSSASLLPRVGRNRDGVGCIVIVRRRGGLG